MTESNEVKIVVEIHVTEEMKTRIRQRRAFVKSFDAIIESREIGEVDLGEIE